MNNPGLKNCELMGRFTKEIAEQISQYAVKNDMSKADVLRKAVREFFERLTKIK